MTYCWLTGHIETENIWSCWSASCACLSTAWASNQQPRHCMAISGALYTADQYDLITLNRVTTLTVLTLTFHRRHNSRNKKKLLPRWWLNRANETKVSHLLYRSINQDKTVLTRPAAEKAETRGESHWGSGGREGGYGRNEKPTHVHINVLHSTMSPSLKEERVNLQEEQKPRCSFTICRWKASASPPLEGPIKVSRTVLILLVNRRDPLLQSQGGGGWRRREGTV